jgi:phosphonoacetate hydrolase
MLVRDVTVNGRTYGWPSSPLVVVCLDGSSFEYIDRAIVAGVAPFLSSLMNSGFFRLVHSALPSITNPNNASIVTGVPPAVHGIIGNFFLDRDSGEAVMMNDASFLRAETIPSAFSRAGAKVAIVTAKDKLRRLLCRDVDGPCVSIEATGVEVYSAALSERALAESVRLLRSAMPDIMYVSTSDYVQHKHAPGEAAANQFYAAVDRSLAAIDRLGATLVLTADHGMRAKADAAGRVRAVFLQEVLDEWLGGPDTARVVLPITDPYVRHHGSLGSCAMVYLGAAPLAVDASTLAERINGLRGIDVAVPHAEACKRFDLPLDRTGDIVVFADADTVVGTRSVEHDLAALDAPLRSHGGRAEQQVPMIVNRHPGDIALAAGTRLHNYDAFDVGLNRSE